MADIKESITENIKYFRSRMDISQQELSGMCGYSSTYIGKIERGQRSPSLDTLIRIAEALQIPVASIFDPFYRQRNQLKEDPDPASYSPYDATLRRFNYLVGRLDPDGTVREVFHLPWFQSDLPAEDLTDYTFRDLPFLHFSSSVRDRLAEVFDQAIEDGPVHLSLRIPGFDFLEETVDLVLVPYPRDSEETEEVRFELFFPRVVRDGQVMTLDDLQFELPEVA